jgi:hypothetical protein
MESASVAQWCHRHDLPFGCLRVVSDEQSTALAPALVRLLSGPHVAAVRLAAVLAFRPLLAWQLARLATDTRLAARRLAVGLVLLLNRE